MIDCQTYVVWDVETLRFSWEVPGRWSNPAGFGLAVAVSQDPRLALTLLAAAFAGLAVVDLLHSAEVLPAEALPAWYGTACAMYDVAIAAVCYLPIVRRP